MSRLWMLVQLASAAWFLGSSISWAAGGPIDQLTATVGALVTAGALVSWAFDEWRGGRR